MFTKGTSGNPSGRPKGFERVARETADAWAAERGITGEHAGLRAMLGVALERIAASTTEDKDKLGYLKFVTERIAGKPRESVDLNVDGPLIDARMIALVEAARMTPHERRQLLEQDDGDEPDEPDEG